MASHRLRIAVLLAAITLAAALIPVIAEIRDGNRYFGYRRGVLATIDSFHSRRPNDIPDDQWREAVDWTSNVIHQDFFSPNAEELIAIEHLAANLEQIARGDVDLGTLRWIWDECEKRCGGPDSSSIRFRDLKLLTKGSISDESLPDVWSVDRCPGLDLSGTQITDASVPFLKTLRQLERLNIYETRISDQGVRELKEARPSLQVYQ